MYVYGKYSIATYKYIEIYYIHACIYTCIFMCTDIEIEIYRYRETDLYSYLYARTYVYIERHCI